MIVGEGQGKVVGKKGSQKPQRGRVKFKKKELTAATLQHQDHPVGENQRELKKGTGDL